MNGPPPPSPEPETSASQGGTFSASISITREPFGSEPFIAFQYDVSLRVFGIALALAKLEGSLNKKIIERNQMQSNQNSSQNGNQNNTGNNNEHEDYYNVVKETEDTDTRSDNTEDEYGNNIKSLAGKKKNKNKNGL